MFLQSFLFDIKNINNYSVSIKSQKLYHSRELEVQFQGTCVIQAQDQHRNEHILMMLDCAGI